MSSVEWEFPSPYDDQTETIPNESVVYRLIHRSWIDWEQVTPSGPRIRSQGFQDYTGERLQAAGCPSPALSMGLAVVLKTHGFDAHEMLHSVQFDSSYGVAALLAREVRALPGNHAQGLMAWPTDAEPWHALMFCKYKEKKSPPISRELAALAAKRWVIIPHRP